MISQSLAPLTLHPFNSLFSRTTRVSRHQKSSHFVGYSFSVAAFIYITTLFSFTKFHVDVLTFWYTNNRKQQQQHLFRSPLSGTTRVSQQQKGKSNLDLLEQEIMSGNGISWAMCKSTPRLRQIIMPAPYHSVFYRPDAHLIQTIV